MAVDEFSEMETRAGRRAEKKARRKFAVHGGSLRTVYPRVVQKRIRRPKGQLTKPSLR